MSRMNETVETITTTTTTELILRQIYFLRECFNISAQCSTDYATAKNTYEDKDALTGDSLYENKPVLDSDGVPLKLTNDIARKAYCKSKCIRELNEMHKAKEEKDSAQKRVEVEISVLSALKAIAKDERIDDDILAKYDLLGDEAGI